MRKRNDWGARRTKNGDLVTIRAVWGKVDGPARHDGRLVWYFLLDGGTKMIRLYVGPGKGEFQVS